MATTLAPYPNLGLQAASYHSVLAQANTTDQFGSRDIWLMDGSDTSDQFVQFEAGLKFMCIGGAATLILIPMEGCKCISHSLRLYAVSFSCSVSYAADSDCLI